MGKGGAHLGSVYLFNQVGVSAKCNLDLLEAVAHTLDNLVGPWIIGGDWNCSPSDLINTGWLKRVGGTVHAPTSPTCNDNTYDFFVTSNSIASEVNSVHLIGDAGFTPHHPARLILRGINRTVLVRQLKVPPPIPANLPFGPMRERPADFDDLVECSSPIEQRYAKLTAVTAEILYDLQGLEPEQIEKAAKWAEGP